MKSKVTTAKYSTGTRFARSDAFIAGLCAEFPGFAIIPKRSSALQRTIDIALKLVTFGGQRHYLTRYHTALFGKLWVPTSYDDMTDDDRYILLRHERIHLVQRKRMGEWLMGAYYLLWFFPLGLAYGRARIEWEAYEETIAATLEVYGEAQARALLPELLRRYTGPDYGWMWPFPSTIQRWFDTSLAAAIVKQNATSES
jgi:hypothetical protein